MDLSSLFSLDGRVALVTGGSRGIGLMITQGLLSQGATVYITARKAEAAQAAAQADRPEGKRSAQRLAGQVRRREGLKPEGARRGAAVARCVARKPGPQASH